MRANRKLGEIETHTLVIFLIVALSAVVLVLILMQVKNILASSSDGSCAARARDMHFTTQTLGRDFVDSDIQGCETEFITIERDDYPQGGEKEIAEAERRMELLLAEEMRQCWRDWGRGELDLFKDQGVYCHVCSRVHFENPGNEAPLQLTNFNVFLYNTISPEGITYAQALTGTTSENVGVDMHIVGQRGDIDTAKDHLILFVYMKHKDQLTLAQLMFGPDAITPGRSGLIAGAAGGSGVAALMQLVGFSIVSGPGGWAVVGTAVSWGAATYIITRAADDFWTISAIYITPEGPGAYNAESCERLAAITQSP